MWFIYSAALNLSGLPSLIGLLLQRNVYSILFPGSHGVGQRFEQTLLFGGLGDLFRLSIDIAVAIFFYRCGPWLIRFLTGEVVESEVSD